MNKLQLQASDPKSSIWVSASAGTGKTKILTDRTLRLLLKGVAPHKILCITFTNAAAAEMQERINNAIFNWSIFDQEKLKTDITNIQGKPPTNQEISTARSLYEEHLRSENNINIQTIHSFCQKILQQFPLEANIPPSFQIIDETKQQTLLNEIKNTIFNQKDLEQINEYLAINFHQLIIDEIIDEIIQNKSKFSELELELQDIEKESTRIIQELNTHYSSYFEDFKNSPEIQTALGDAFEIKDLYKLFLTTTGEKKKRIVKSAIAKPDSGLYIKLAKLQEEFHLRDQQFKSNQIRLFSELIYILSSQLIAEYNKVKRTKGLLDYDDLIDKAAHLLCDSAMREWVLYKLDGLIDHLLVDEAQDTSPSQWSIINALITEFHSGEGSKESDDRTIFVVGDAKQSIFSFQGADVNIFAQTNLHLAEKMYHARKPFSNVNLEKSYRSSPAILDVVYSLFKNQQQSTPNLFSMPLYEISAHRKEAPGSVELWPLSTSNNDKEKFWPIENEPSTEESAKNCLANDIAKHIQKLIASGEILPATGKPISYNDIMILFRKRDEFTHQVIKSLEDHNLSVSGLDRFALKDNISIKDLLSIARFLLNPDDDLNLACLLKSPIISADSQILSSISASKESYSIWQYLSKNKDKENYSITYKKLHHFQELYKQTNVLEFFYHIIEVMGYRKILSQHNGLGSDDAINELIYACNNYVQQIDNSLQNFIFWIDNNHASIKRENLTHDQIRIMTLHASKGLQSPIVILCDTTSLPHQKERFYWSNQGELVINNNSNNISDGLKHIKSLEKEKAMAEYLRLLYVGMTRAEDHLIVCGYKETKTTPENCWYQMVRATLESMPNILNIDNKLIYKTGDKQGNVSKVAAPFEKQAEIFYPKEHSLHSLNNNVGGQRTTKQDFRVNYYMSPFGSTSPLEYGRIFHKILEDSISAKDLSKMHKHPLISNLKPSDQKRISNSIQIIQKNEELVKLLQYKCWTEVSLGKMERNHIDARRVDLMIHAESEVVIIDYKSDLKPAHKLSDVPEGYIIQLNNYGKICKEIYPGQKISTKILWLESGVMMDI